MLLINPEPKHNLRPAWPCKPYEVTVFDMESLEVVRTITVTENPLGHRPTSQ